MAKGSKQSQQGNALRPELLPYIKDFGRFSRGMLVLGEMAPERMTMAQGVFFILAGAYELAGKSPTYSTIKDAVGDQLNRSLHTTYRILLEPSRAFPKGLGWLTTEVNPADNREKFLKLTALGTEVMLTVALAITGD